MPGFIEELYYDNIKPQEKSIRESESFAEERRILYEHERYLLKNLPEELKPIFMEYADTWSTLNGKTTFEGFSSGFRLGAGFAADAFCKNEISIAEYIKDQ